MPKKSKRRTIVRYVRVRRRRKAGPTLPLAAALGLAGGVFVPPAGRSESAFDHIRRGNWNEAFVRLSENYIGYSPATRKWVTPVGLLMAVAGMLVHKIVGGYLGVNRMLGRARVPVIRL